MRKGWTEVQRCRKEYEKEGTQTAFCQRFLEVVRESYGKDFDFAECIIERWPDRDVVLFKRYTESEVGVFDGRSVLNDPEMAHKMYGPITTKYRKEGPDTAFCQKFLEILRESYGKDFDFAECIIERATESELKEGYSHVVTFHRYAEDAESDLRQFEEGDRELIDKWREAAAKVPESTRHDIVAMKKSGKSVRQIAGDLELAWEHVAVIVREEFAKERGETPDWYSS